MYVGLRKLRKENQIPVQVLAELLDLKTEAAYYKKESGLIKFSVEEARKIADYFDQTIEDIFLENDCRKWKASNCVMANFSRIDASYQELKECPRCHCEIQQGGDRCIRCGLVLDLVIVWMIKKHEKGELVEQE